MKKIFPSIIILFLMVCTLMAGCTNNINYELVSYPLGAPLLAEDYKTQLFKYNTFEEFESGIVKYNTLDNDVDYINSVNETLFANAFLLHVIIYHTSSDTAKIKKIYKTENSVNVEILMKYPNNGQAEDIMFTHYFIKIDRTELNYNDLFILKGNYKI